MSFSRICCLKHLSVACPRREGQYRGWNDIKKYCIKIPTSWQRCLVKIPILDQRRLVKISILDQRCFVKIPILDQRCLCFMGSSCCRVSYYNICMTLLYSYTIVKIAISDQKCQVKIHTSVLQSLIKIYTIVPPALCSQNPRLKVMIWEHVL